MPTQRAMPQKSGASAVLNASGIVTRAATEPKTLARKILPKAALSPPAAKKRPHEMKAVGRIRWKFSGRPSVPVAERARPAAVTQWNVKFRESSVQRKERIPMTIARGANRFGASAHEAFTPLEKYGAPPSDERRRRSVAASDHGTGTGPVDRAGAVYGRLTVRGNRCDVLPHRPVPGRCGSTPAARISRDEAPRQDAAARASGECRTIRPCSARSAADDPHAEALEAAPRRPPPAPGPWPRSAAAPPGRGGRRAPRSMSTPPGTASSTRSRWSAASKPSVSPGWVMTLQT